MAKHGKRDAREELKGKVRGMLKNQANKKPGGESARELKRQDIDKWKRGRR